MIKEDVNELATWTGQGIGYYSGSKRSDVGSVFCRAGLRLDFSLFYIRWLEYLNMK